VKKLLGSSLLRALERAPYPGESLQLPRQIPLPFRPVRVRALAHGARNLSEFRAIARHKKAKTRARSASGKTSPADLHQPAFAGTNATEETDEDKPALAATAAAWPKRPGERIAAIRDLVVASKRLWQTAEVAAAFKGSKKKDVADLLDSLAGIGVLVAYGETEKELRWGLPTRAVG
jgi:hypothetical protein